MLKIHRRGATVVEFAITFPVLLVVVFAGVELTRFSMLKHTANHAAQAATRSAIVPGANVPDVVAKAEDHLATIGIREAIVTVAPNVITEATNKVEVEVTFPAAANSLVVPEFVSGNITGLSAMITERSRSQMSLNLPAPPPPPAPPTPPPEDDDDSTPAGDDNSSDDKPQESKPKPPPPRL